MPFVPSPLFYVVGPIQHAEPVARSWPWYLGTPHAKAAQGFKDSPMGR